MYCINYVSKAAELVESGIIAKIAKAARNILNVVPLGVSGTDVVPLAVDTDGKLQIGGAVTATVDVSTLATHAKQDTVDGHITAMSSKLPAALGQTTLAASLSIVPASDAGMATAANQVTSNAATTAIARIPVVDAVAFARPNDPNAYTAGDAVANSTTAGSVNPVSFTVSDTNDAPVALRSATLAINGTAAGTANASFRLHLFRNSPTATAGDNAPFTYPAIASEYLGSLSGQALLFSDGSVATLYPDGSGQDILCRPTSGGRTIYGLLQTLTAFTPAASATKTLTLKGFQGRA
jgi:hypothetical protein